MQKGPSFSLDIIWKFLLTSILLFYALIEASNILIPIVFSVFLAMIFNPVVNGLVKRRVNKVLAILMVMILTMIILTFGIYFVSIQSKNLISDIPDLTIKFKAFLDEIASTFSSLTGFSSDEQLTLIKQNTDQFISSGSSVFSNAVSATSSFITFISIVPIYVFFMLYYKHNFKRFLILVAKSSGNEMIDLIKEIQSMVYSYMSGLLIVISIIAVLNSIGLGLLGIKYAIFMSILAALLTIIPYIGIILGAALPVTVALLTKDSIFYPIGVIGVFAVVQFLEGNFITPNIVGSKVNVNPLAAIIGLLIGGAIWGIIGMIIAIPMLGITQIILRHIDGLKPYALLLSATHHDHDLPKEKVEKAETVEPKGDSESA